MSADRRPAAIVLMGPTASGKSALAISWAERLNGEIVSVDSALVYRGLDIGSAKPDADEQQRVPHHMLDLREPWQPYSAAEFSADARRAVDGILARGRLPILTGGTGLYFRALLDGLSPMPAADVAMRAAIAAEAHTRGWPALHAELAYVDHDAAAMIKPNDAQRVQRALEVWRLTGRAISDWQREPSTQQRLPCRVLQVVVAPRERLTLHARIERRFDAMLDDGFLDEVLALRAHPLLVDHVSPRELPALRAVGYRQAWRHLDGETSARDFRNQAIFATRQLAKRQLTWLRSQRAARWFDTAIDQDRLDEAIGLFLGISATIESTTPDL